MLKTKRKLPRAVVQVGCIPVSLQASILAFTIFSHVGSGVSRANTIIMHFSYFKCKFALP